MAHFARVDRVTGIVQEVIVADQEFIDNYADSAPGDWIQTSYNTAGGVHYVRDEDGTPTVPSEDQSKALRYNYATVGGNYDYDADAFYGEQPYPSFTLNTDTYMWEPPIPFPGHDNPEISYTWDEDAYQADTSDPKTEGWVVLSTPEERANW